MCLNLSETQGMVPAMSSAGASTLEARAAATGSVWISAKPRYRRRISAKRSLPAAGAALPKHT
jgi:hypothetical protein